jgi:hypothetical protein
VRDDDAAVRGERLLDHACVAGAELQGIVLFLLLEFVAKIIFINRYYYY